MNLKRKFKSLINLLVDYYQFIRICFLDKQDKFSYIYQSKYWRGSEDGSLSGGGSNEISTNVFIEELSNFIEAKNINSILDIPCGDWKWMSSLDLSNINYIGCDIVPDLISSNNKKYKKNNINFFTKSLIDDELPDSDLIIVRDLLVHLDNKDIAKCLMNLKKSKYKYIGITNYPNLEINKKRLFGDYLRLGDKWRAINLTKEPYNLSMPTLNLSDKNSLTDIDKNKYVSIWKNEDFNISKVNIKL